MKMLSTVFTLSLLIPIVACSFAAFQVFYQTNSDLIPKDTSSSLARPFIIFALTYFVVLILSVWLNIKRKFLVNIILSGCLIIFYIITVNFVGIHG